MRTPKTLNGADADASGGVAGAAPKTQARHEEGAGAGQVRGDQRKGAVARAIEAGALFLREERE